MGTPTPGELDLASPDPDAGADRYVDPFDNYPPAELDVDDRRRLYVLVEQKPTAAAAEAGRIHSRALTMLADADDPAAAAAGIAGRLEARARAIVAALGNSNRCAACGRALTNTRSKALGIGPECLANGRGALLTWAHRILADVDAGRYQPDPRTNPTGPTRVAADELPFR